MTTVDRVFISHQPHGNQARLSAHHKTGRTKIWGKPRVSFDYWGNSCYTIPRCSYNPPLSHAGKCSTILSLDEPSSHIPLPCLVAYTSATDRQVEPDLIMSTEKAGTEVHHDISNDNRASHDIQYPVVAEGTGKTLDEAHGAKAKEVHNVSLRVYCALPATSSSHTIDLPCICAFIEVSPHQLTALEPIGRILRRCSGVQDREMEQELHHTILFRLHRILLCLRQRL